MTSRVARDFREVARRGRWFAALPERFADGLLAAANVRVLSDGEVLFSRGDPPGGLFAIVDGMLRVGGISDAGKEALLTLLGPPTWFGEVSVLDGQPRTHDAVADGEATVLHVPERAIASLLAADPHAWRYIGLLVASKLRLAFEAMEDVALLPLGLRLARRLASMADAFGEQLHHSQRRLEVSQDQLAGLLSTSRQTVNQLLKELESRTLIRIGRGSIEIVDLDGLRAAGNLETT